MTKEWDLNIYFLEEYDVETDETSYSDTIRINPVLWTMDQGATQTHYSNWYIETTFAETRYIRSQYPEDEYGMDWTDSLTNFLNIAPPRLQLMLASLPPSIVMDESAVKDLVG